MMINHLYQAKHGCHFTVKYAQTTFLSIKGVCFLSCQDL